MDQVANTHVRSDAWIIKILWRKSILYHLGHIMLGCVAGISIRVSRLSSLDRTIGMGRVAAGLQAGIERRLPRSHTQEEGIGFLFRTKAKRALYHAPAVIDLLFQQHLHQLLRQRAGPCLQNAHHRPHRKMTQACSRTTISSCAALTTSRACSCRCWL